MQKQDWLKQHFDATAYCCKDAEDVEAELKRRKAMAFQAFMAFMDLHHPRKESKLQKLSLPGVIRVWVTVSAHMAADRIHVWR